MKPNTITSWLLASKYKLEKCIHPLESVTLEVTGRCNLNCIHCYKNANNSNVDITLETITKFATNLRHDFKQLNQIRITGGEPMFRKDIIQILDVFKSHNFQISLSSNGTLITKELANQLATRIETIAISIDGTKESHNFIRNNDTYETTIKGIETLKEANVQNIVIKTTVSTKNIDEIQKIYELLKKLNFTYWHVFPIEANGRAYNNKTLLLNEKQYDNLRNTLLEINKENKIKIFFGETELKPYCNKLNKQCIAGIKTVAILHNGDIVSCICEPNQIPQGNIVSDNFTTIWNTKFNRNRAKAYNECGCHQFKT